MSIHTTTPGDSAPQNAVHPEEFEPLTPEQLATEPQGPGQAGPSWASRALAGSAQWGVALAFVLTVVVFYALKPDVFSDINTWKGILNQAAVPGIIAIGLTVALVTGDFDLSIGNVLGLAMAICIVLMAEHHVAWQLACLVALGVSVVVGLVNGALVSRLHVNSFIGTLAVGSIVGGIDAKVSGQKTISTNIPSSFASFGGHDFLGLSITFWICVILGVALYLLVAHSEPGRFMYAVGGNREAARLAGVRVASLRTAGFVLAAFGAGLAGVMLAAQSASYYPNAGTGFLLPAYAAAFLGTALGGGRFGIAATAFGVLFLQTLQTGLTVLNVETWVVLVVQGSVLLVAVIVGGFGGAIKTPTRRRKPAAATAAAH